MKIKINKLISGALSGFRGYGDIIASTGGAEKTMKMIRFASSTASLIRDRSGEKGYFPMIWFMPGKEKTFFILHQEKYTRFPEENRFYNQNIFSWFSTDEIRNANLGDLITSAKLFRQYQEECLGKSDDTLDVIHQDVEVSQSLVNRLSMAADQGKKLLIQISTEGLQLQDNGFADYEPFKKLFYAVAELPAEIRQKISISTQHPHEHFPKCKVESGSKTIPVPARAAHYSLWDGTECSSGNIIGMIASWLGKADYYPAEPETTKEEKIYEHINFLDFRVPATNVLIWYGNVPDNRREYYQKEGYEIVSQEILQ